MKYEYLSSRVVVTNRVSGVRHCESLLTFRPLYRYWNPDDGRYNWVSALNVLDVLGVSHARWPLAPGRTQ